MRDRSEVVCGRFTLRERKAIQAQAKSDGLSESEYVRAAVMTMLVFDGNTEAIKVTAQLMREKFGQVVGSKLAEVQPASA